MGDTNATRYAISIKGFIAMSAMALGLAVSPAGQADNTSTGATAPATMLRIRIGTVATPDVDRFNESYGKWLDYTVRERGTISAATARSWGVPAMAGRRYSLLSSDADPDVFIRAVEVAAIEGYRPVTTFGWNAFEIIVQDVQAVRKRLTDGPFTIIGEPRPLKSRPSIHAMQVIGPGQEVLYLTTETGDQATSTLPLARGPIARQFIMVLGGPDVLAMRDFYTETFNLEKHPLRESRADTVQRAWGGTESGTHPITLVRLKQHGNSMQLDGYVKPGLGPRPRAEGELPPGNSMSSFSVPDLDAVRVKFVQPPTVLEGAAYGGARSATFIGPAGELTELIEERP